MNNSENQSVKIPFSLPKSKTLWTEDQLRAINTRGRDVIVSASAGTGKTSVMIERIAGLLQEGYSLDRMLVVTFTNAAALDMKDKLAKRLAADNIKADVASADIGTLHSWCKKLIGEYFFHTRLDPDFEVLEGAARQKLFAESLTAVIAEAAEADNPVFESLTAVLGGRNDEGLKHALTALYNHLIIRPEFDIRLSDGEAADKLKEIFKLKAEGLAAEARQLHYLTQAAGFERNIEATHELIGCAETLTAAVLSPKSKIPPQLSGLNDRYKGLKERINTLAAQSDEAKDAFGTFGGFGELLLQTAKRLNEVYGGKKRAAAALDFSDLEHFALKILRSEAGEEIRKGYDFVFVDEYQDINPLQNHIIDCVKTDGRLFIVGDLKQSIYAFRGCEPEIFSDKIKKALAGNTEVVSLNDNHRSRPKILHFANDLFCRIMTRGFGGTDYAAGGKFVLADDKTKEAGGQDGKVGIYLYKDCDEIKTGVYDLTRDGGEQESEGVKIAALRIAEILSGGVVTREGTRKAEPSDIAVLVRGGCPSVDALIKKLESMGIKAEASEALRGGGCRQVSALIEYLKLIDNRYDDVALINSLKSRFGGFSDGELAEIRNFCPDAEYFYLAAEGLAAENPKKEDAENNILSQRLSGFYQRLEDYRLLAASVSVEELVGKVVSDARYFQHVFLYGASPASALDAFLNAIPNSGAAGLSEFLQELEAPAAAPPAGNAVKIMTVHAAKGLEFPFVILLDAQKEFNQTDLSKPLILFDDLLGFKNYGEDSREGKNSTEWLLNKYSLQKRQKEEEMRLLYVAVTRAKLSLDIIAEAKEDLSCLEGLGEDLGESPADCRCWLRWLLPLCLKYAARPPLEPEKAARPPQDTSAPVFAAALKKSFDFAPEKSTLPPKTYVTALLAQGDEGERAVYIGDGDADRAAYVGTLYHKAMENLDFSLDFEAQWQLLDGEIKQETDKAGLKAAFDTVGGRLSGYRVFKEQGFIADIPAAEAGFKQDGSVLVQGVIDVLAIRDGQAVIVDYKTGGIDPKYKKQLSLYALAAQKILNLRTESLLIYSFKQKKLLEV